MSCFEIILNIQIFRFCFAFPQSAIFRWFCVLENGVGGLGGGDSRNFGVSFLALAWGSLFFGDSRIS
ncbi:hypothetical protein BBW65_01970 [Helicobacter enhydrae]|uniref:Uncharacterized protein n=1 Tax=Helicobacter enhydrae TaxID=222136 RepID=A0A1B1U4D8_9HELI|nr:hypothetical protein BBW65_01970 [Helicobacter enhydrae]